MLKRIFLILFLFFLMGCGSTKGNAEVMEHSGMDRVRYMELRELAKVKLECEAESIEYQYEGDKLHLLKGCGKQVRYLVFPYNGLWVKTESFHLKAAFELECDVEDLTYERASEDVWFVSGCGRTAEYMLVCDDSQNQCKWLSDG